MRHRTDNAAAPKRVLAYCRVSTLEQGTRGTSLDAQREEIERHCRSLDLPAPLMFVETESGAGSKSEARVEQVRLMHEVRAGDLVIVAKQDRWSRDTLHFLASVDEITRRGARFFSLAERFDPSTPEGRLAATMMASMAEHERARIRIRTVGSRQRLRAMGHWVEGTAPLGYRRDDKARKLVEDETTGPIVRRMFARCIAGQSTREIARDLRAAFPGVPALDAQAIARRLRDRRYLGEIPAVGVRGPSGQRRVSPETEWIKGALPALISPATFRRAQDALASRDLGGRPLTGDATTAGFLLRGRMHCAVCGHVIAAHGKRAYSSIKHGGYYFCAYRAGGESGVGCPAVRGRQDEIDAEVERQLLTRLEQLAKRLAKPAPKAAAPAEPTPDFSAERERLRARRGRLVEAIAEGTITREDAREKLRKTDADLADIDRREIALADRKPAPSQADRRAQLEHVSRLRAAWGRLTVDEKREALGLLVARIELGRREGAQKWARGAWEVRIVWAT